MKLNGCTYTVLELVFDSCAQITSCTMYIPAKNYTAYTMRFFEIQRATVLMRLARVIFEPNQKLAGDMQKDKTAMLRQ